ncbi:MAG TPA: hypothetical protein PKW95_15900 [bacterium]|nr:hypothetical protein [bacterium]
MSIQFVEAKFSIIGQSPYSNSRYLNIEKGQNQSYDEWEDEHWREKLHYDRDGQVFIPPMALHYALSETAKFLGKKVKGSQRGFTAQFTKGIAIDQRLYLGVHIEDPRIYPEKIHVPSDGKRGGAKRVARVFPTIDEWRTEATVHIAAPEITKDIFEEHIVATGFFNGLGRFRPQNNGYYGRFVVEDLVWKQK